MFAVGWVPTCLASAAAGCVCSCCTAATQQAMRSSARAAWSVLFTLSIVTAWLARDFGASLLKQLPCETPPPPPPRPRCRRRAAASPPPALPLALQG